MKESLNVIYIINKHEREDYQHSKKVGSTCLTPRVIESYQVDAGTWVASTLAFPGGAGGKSQGRGIYSDTSSC